MDKELSEDAQTHRGDLKAVDGNHPSPRSRRPGRRQKPHIPPPASIELLLKTTRHFLPKLAKQINAIADPRKIEQSVYTQAHLVWLGILLFMMHLGSRRQMRFERLSECFEQNLAKLCRQQDIETIADPDTLAYYAQRVPVKDIEKLLAWITVRLIRMKALDPFRLYGYFPIAIDGSQICTFDAEPWPKCPHRTLSDGSVQYFAYVLDAKLLTPCGMALSLATEMLTNEGHEQFDKQDCELKAFSRLVEKLRDLFPRTPFCLLLDSLYANQNVIRLIESRSWKYIITFKEGSMPERYREAKTLAKLQVENRRRVAIKNGSQFMQWVHQLPVAEFKPDVLFCREKIKGKEATRFAWLTNFRISPRNVENIANKGGRLRWKIENEGFNVQKNDGYEMEHPYSEHPNGFRVFYILLLIAHYITQLILHGNLIRSLAKSFGSAKNFARRLAESMRNHVLPDDLPMPGQIRFQPP
jgi:hypothetical protein